MLEVESIGLQGAEADLEFSGNVGFQHGRLWVYAEDCHILTVQSLPLLVYPENIEFCLKLVGDLDLFLAA